MPEPRELTEEGLEHLQRAGRELLSAARSFLDAVEGVVEDRERLASLAEGVGGALSEAVGALRPLGERLADPDRPRPWEAAATRAPEPPSWDSGPTVAGATATGPTVAHEPDPDPGTPDEGIPDATAPGTTIPGPGAPDGPAPEPPAVSPGDRPRARVRRIPVD
ncbi:MAG: hypothetical protein ACOYOP_06125 [Microthrixaceae bacterium]